MDEEGVGRIGRHATSLAAALPRPHSIGAPIAKQGRSQSGDLLRHVSRSSRAPLRNLIMRAKHYKVSIETY